MHTQFGQNFDFPEGYEIDTGVASQHHNCIAVVILEKAFIETNQPNKEKRKKEKVSSVGSWYTLTQLMYHEVNLNREIVKLWRKPGQLSFLF